MLDEVRSTRRTSEEPTEWAPVAAEILRATERFGWRRMETAAHLWAGRMRRAESGCPASVVAWRKSIADVVCDALAWRGVEGLEFLALRVVVRVEDVPSDRAHVLDPAIARWSRLVHALDVHNGVPSSFPLCVLAPADLAAIAALAEEIDGAWRHRDLVEALRQAA